MKKRGLKWVLTACGILMLTIRSLAATHYVAPPGTGGVTPEDPYTNWATAGTSMIAVVNAAMTNDASRLVLVTNGTYYITNVVLITLPVVIRSVNGRDETFLDGGGGVVTGLYAFNFYSSAANSYSTAMDGFTISNYNLTQWTSRIVHGNQYSLKNCRFVNNTVNGYAMVNFAWGGVMTNCIFQDNEASYGSGAARLAFSAANPRNTLVSHCRFENNTAVAWHGGAIQAVNTLGVMSNCVFIGNTASGKGGAIEHAGTNVFNIVNCTFISNSVLCNSTAKQGDGGALFAETNVTIRNSLLVENYAKTNGGGIYMHIGLIENCTVAGNEAAVAGGGLFLAGAVTGLNNIVYSNDALSGADWSDAAGDADFAYSCASPAFTGDGNMDIDPRFVEPAAGNWELAAESPCIHRGLNQGWMFEPGAVDLAGQMRIDRFGKRVDMGCYECLLYGAMFSVR